MVLYAKEILTASPARSAHFCFNYFRGRCEDQSNIYRMSAALARWARANGNVSLCPVPSMCHLPSGKWWEENRGRVWRWSLKTEEITTNAWPLPEIGKWYIYIIKKASLLCTLDVKTAEFDVPTAKRRVQLACLLKNVSHPLCHLLVCVRNMRSLVLKPLLQGLIESKSVLSAMYI